MSKVGGYLLSGETLLWKGRPQQGIRLYSQDLFLLPFSLLWGGTVLTMFSLGWRSFLAMPFPFFLILPVFTVIAVYIAAGRFIHDAWIRSNLEYALTDRRVIILRTGWGRELRSLEIGRINQINFYSRGERGDIVFGKRESFFDIWPRSLRTNCAVWTPSLSNTPQLLGVENARRLFEQIERLKAQTQR